MAPSRVTLSHRCEVAQAAVGGVVRQRGGWLGVHPLAALLALCLEDIPEEGVLLARGE
jgi:hypothetical protein